LDVIEPIITGLGLPVHDPFAGTGERLGERCDRNDLRFTGTDREASFIVDPRVREGTSIDANTYPTGPFVVVGSPPYLNTPGDHHDNRGTGVRHDNTYEGWARENRGDPSYELHADNLGRFGVRQGEQAIAEYFRIAALCVSRWPDDVILNVKDVQFK